MKAKPATRSKAFDWRAFRARIEQIHQSAREKDADGNQARRILEERARALGRVSAPEGPAGTRLETVAFGLGNERYAIEAGYVLEVTRLTELTQLPGAPAFFAGVINRRGEILGVVDLRLFFGLTGSGEVDRV